LLVNHILMIYVLIKNNFINVVKLVVFHNKLYNHPIVKIINLIKEEEFKEQRIYHLLQR
jgi:hypothetical protein